MVYNTCLGQKIFTIGLPAECDAVDDVWGIIVQNFGRLKWQSSNIFGASVRMGGNIVLVRGQGPPEMSTDHL